MIEATCGACGTVNRFAEGDVPIGTKFLPCASCKSRVNLPGRATMPGAQPIPKIPATPPPRPPPIPVPLPQGAKPAVIDLADLPAPKRASPLAGNEPSKPAPRSALSEVGKAAVELDDLIPQADLPAPKTKLDKGAVRGPLPGGKAPSTGPVPTVKPITGSMPTVAEPVADLPAPKSRLADLPRPAAEPQKALADLPAPRPKAGVPDLPAPRPKAGVPDLPAPTSPRTPATARTQTPIPRAPDLPAPRGLADLPKPRSGVADLPAPRAKPPSNPPVARAEPDDLLTPRAELPQPKGFFDDLPQPAGPGKPELPAPKGFFDDLPQPAGPGKPELPAPKGFFDDLPQPANPNKPDLPAPKGFFEDLPQRANPNKPDLPAPKGFFEDLPQRANPNKPDLPAPKGFFEDLPQRAHPSKQPTRPPPPLEGQPLEENLAELDLDLGGTDPPPRGMVPSRPPPIAARAYDEPAELDLGDSAPPPTPSQPEPYRDLELSPPSDPAGIRISAPKPKPAAPPVAPVAAKPAELTLETEELRGGKAAYAENKAERRRLEKAAPAPRPQSSGLARKLLFVVLGLAAAGGGGFYLYQRHEAAEQRAQQIDSELGKARAALSATDPQHWQRAGTAAGVVIGLDAKNAEALGIAAEAALAGALDSGINGTAKIAQGKKLIADALAAGVTGPALDRAQALAAITSNQPDRALQKLVPLATKQPKSPFLQLYVGWAQLAKGDAAEAIKAFDLAAAASPPLKAEALYDRGRAKLVLADFAGARTDFAAVLEIAKDHVGAQVGLAATLPPSQSQQRESDLLAILARKDIASADPRVVLEAWTLAADVARLGGRLDVARERYRKALALSALHVPALTGLALVEVRDGKLEAANGLLDKALAQAKDDPDAQLVKGEVEIREGKLGNVAAVIKNLAARTPPLPPLQLAHLDLVKGKLLEAQGDDEAAIEAYTDGANAAGDLDLSPTMAAVEKLGALAKKADDNKDPKKAEAYRTRADQLLSALADRAQDDPQLAMTLGVAYLAAGDATKAEALLRRATEMRANDVEAKLELAKALGKLGRSDDAIEQLRGALAIDGNRSDVALELARAFEAAGHDGDAIDAYSKLLAAKDVDVQVRVHAGRFFAKQREIAKAAVQAEPILAADPSNAAGHYLRAEGLLAGGKLDDARKEAAEAVDADPDPQYLDAQGRIAEASAAATGDGKYVDLALRAYARTVETDPKQLNAQQGLGRLYVQRKEFDKAVPPLLAASHLDEKNTEVMYELGVAYQAVQQKPTAILWLAAAVKSGDHRAEIQWRLAELYFDVNRLRECLQAYTEATRLGTEEEKQGGKKLDWLTDAWYRLGDLQQSSNEAGTRHAWEMYVGRNPEPGVRLNAAKYWLKTHQR